MRAAQATVLLVIASLALACVLAAQPGVWHGVAAQEVNGHTCIQTLEGNILVFPFTRYAPPATPTGEAIVGPGPRKIVLAEDMPGTVLICWDKPDGTTCKPLAALFRDK
jgi:hypothetical protein